jgi:hypothetical protein
MTGGGGGLLVQKIWAKKWRLYFFALKNQLFFGQIKKFEWNF